MIGLVVFDLDGTLVDSHRDLAEATNALLTELGAAPLSHDVVTSLVGEGAAVLVRRALERAGLDPEHARTHSSASCRTTTPGCSTRRGPIRGWSRR